MSLNNPVLWKPNDLEHAYSLVGGTNKQIHLTEPQSVAKRLSAYIKDKAQVLELGCGFGRIILALDEVLKQQHKQVHVYGFDFSEDMLKLGKEHLKNLNNVLLMSNLQLPSKSIDFIYSHAVFIHNTEQQISDLFISSKLLLKPNAIMVHDFLDAAQPAAQTEMKQAQAVNFPFYGYTEKQIKGMAHRHGFSCQRVTHGPRSSFLFRS